MSALKLKRVTSIITLLLIVSACSLFTNKLISIDGFTMGTTYSVKLYGNGLSEENKTDLKKELDSILVDINRQMSTYKPDSEISLFNQKKDTGWVKISEDFYNVIKASHKVASECGGAFDITVGPLVNLWGFGPGNSKRIVPLQKEINKAKKNVGYWNIVSNDSSEIMKKMSSLYVDLSAVAKGYAVDKIAGYLSEKGFGNYLVEIGGEIKTAGKNHERKVWQIGILTPDNTNTIQKVLNITSKAVATSGDYRNYFEKDGVRYSHTIDPRTGKPISHKLASVSVIHESCALADAYATAITVLGPEDGYNFAVSNNLEVLLIIKGERSFREKATPGFKKFIEVVNVVKN